MRAFLWAGCMALALCAALVVPPGPAARAASPACAGVPATIVGSSAPDVLVGTAGDDVIVAGAGADRVYGRAGDDLVCGGAGADRLLGEEGNDRLIGGGGPDRLFGGPGAFDELTADPGRDVLDGGPGELDRVDYSRSRSGVVVNLPKGRSVERRLGGQRDRLRNLAVVVGSAFPDVLIGDADANVLAGAGGSDLLIGGPGVDLGLALSPTGVQVDLRRGRASGEGADRLEGLEGFVGGAGADLLAGSEAAETLVGGAGPDRLLGRAGSDALYGGWGADELSGGRDADRLTGGRGEDALAGDGGFDLDEAAFAENGHGVFLDLENGYAQERVAGGERDRLAGIEGAQGTASADVMLGDELPNSLEGGAGADDLRGYAGDDYLDGGRGEDLADGMTGLDTCYAETASRCERPGDGTRPERIGAPGPGPAERRMERALRRLLDLSSQAADLPAHVAPGPATCVVTAGRPSELTVTAPTAVAPTTSRIRAVFWQPVVYRWTGARWERFASQRYLQGLAFGGHTRAAGPLAGLVGTGGPLQAGPAAAWRRLADGVQDTTMRFDVPVDAYFTVLHYVEWAGGGSGFTHGRMQTLVVEPDGALTGPAGLAPWCRS